MKMLGPVVGLALVSLATLATLPVSESQYTFLASGIAIRGEETFRAGLSRHPDPMGFPHLSVSIAKRNPNVFDVLQIDFVEGAEGVVVDTFNGAPGASIQIGYQAHSLDPNFDFDFEGVQVARIVTGVGHWKDYTIVVSADMGF